MSYTFLAEQGEESSADCFSDIPLSALSKSSHIAERFCSNANETESCLGFQSGTTCEHSTEDHGEELPILYAVDFRAKTYHVRGKEKELKEKEADCGPSMQGSLAKYNHFSFSWKTAQCSLFGGLTQFSGIWPRWGSIRNGELLEPGIPVLHTFEKGYGSFPTVCSFDRHAIKNLRKDSNLMDGGRHSTSLVHFLGGMPNPTWAEWLMGWPMTWTELKPLEMDKYLEWLHLHGASCAKEPPPEHCGNGQHSIQQRQYAIPLDIKE
jgi:hypothetical protein